MDTSEKTERIAREQLPSLQPGTFEWYQAETLKTLLQSADNLPYLFALLASEAGEANGVWSKVIRDNGGQWTGEYREKLVKELGDCLYAIAVIADWFGYPLHIIAEQNIYKLRDRKERGTLGGSGDER